MTERLKSHHKSRNSECKTFKTHQESKQAVDTENMLSYGTTNSLSPVKEKGGSKTARECEIDNYQIFSTFNCNNHQIVQNDGQKINISHLLNFAKSSSDAKSISQNIDEERVDSSLEHNMNNFQPTEPELPMSMPQAFDSYKQVQKSRSQSRIAKINKEFSKIEEITPTTSTLFKDYHIRKQAAIKNKKKIDKKGFRKCMIG